MKGTDIPQEEIDRVKEFLRVSGNDFPEKFIADREKTIRLIAWYGYLRRNGDNSGKFVSKRQGTL